jgi:hypothetical protein
MKLSNFLSRASVVSSGTLKFVNESVFLWINIDYALVIMKVNGIWKKEICTYTLIIEAYLQRFLFR